MRYESTEVLENALKGCPDVRLVLTSTQPWAHGLSEVLERLGQPLASRVVGYTFDDLTSKVPRGVLTPSGTTRAPWFSSEDYWRMSKADIAAASVEWSHPQRWLVMDDEDILWLHNVRRDRLVLTDGCAGPACPATRHRLMTLLVGNFGAAETS